MPRDPGRPPEPADDDNPTSTGADGDPALPPDRADDDPSTQPPQPQGAPREAIDRPTEDAVADTPRGGLGATIAVIVAIVALTILLFALFRGDGGQDGGPATADVANPEQIVAAW
jgi:hypothetical protein